MKDITSVSDLIKQQNTRIKEMCKEYDELEYTGQDLEDITKILNGAFIKLDKLKRLLEQELSND
jgi:hypothetical protein